MTDTDTPPSTSTSTIIKDLFAALPTPSWWVESTAEKQHKAQMCSDPEVVRLMAAAKEGIELLPPRTRLWPTPGEEPMDPHRAYAYTVAILTGWSGHPCDAGFLFFEVARAIAGRRGVCDPPAEAWSALCRLAPKIADAHLAYYKRTGIARDNDWQRVLERGFTGTRGQAPAL